MDHDTPLLCRCCDAPSTMLTAEGFCPRCFWKLERAALSVRIGRAETIRIEPGASR